VPKFRLVLALCAFFVPALLLQACGGDSVPGNSVAKVRDTTVTNSDFQHWLRIAAISQQGQVPGQTGAPAVPDPPNFTNCIAQKRKTAPKPAKGQPAPSDAQFKATCQQQYTQLRDQVMQFLITSQWFQGEAADQGITVSQQQVNKQLDQTKRQRFPTPQAYNNFLKTSGYTTDDILFRLRLGLLQNKLRDRIVKGKSKVTDAQISRYYAKNRAQFGQPERRDLLLILTRQRGPADQAKAQLAGGAKWAPVAKRFSTDPQTKNAGGVLVGATKQGGQLEPQLATVVFSTPVNKLTGPVKTQFGWYVFKVTKVTPASQQSQQQATPTIKAILANQNQQKALDAFIKGFRDKWTALTVCRTGFVVQDCKNAPKPKKGTTTRTATTG
jgi:foldase protein PrsA